MRFFALLLAFSIPFIPASSWAQGCPIGQYQIGGQGAVACAPIPQGNSIQQEPRPSGKWIETWGAIASDDEGGNLGVSTGILKRKNAEKDAVEKCERESQKKCTVVMAYNNQCASVARPDGKGTITYNRGPSAEGTSQNALSECQKENNSSKCSIIYENCTKQIFKSF
ncbi:DUF4189 domain-containing protein [Xanthomonas campestris pv. plantaginis]